MPNTPQLVPGQTDDLTFTAEATTHTGVVVPVEVKVTFPKNQGMTALKVLQRISEDNAMQGSIVSDLASRGDLSLLAAMDAAGLTLDDEEGN